MSWHLNSPFASSTSGAFLRAVALADPRLVTLRNRSAAGGFEIMAWERSGISATSRASIAPYTDFTSDYDMVGLDANNVLVVYSRFVGGVTTGEAIIVNISGSSATTAISVSTAVTFEAVAPGPRLCGAAASDNTKAVVTWERGVTPTVHGMPLTFTLASTSAAPITMGVLGDLTTGTPHHGNVIAITSAQKYLVSLNIPQPQVVVFDASISTFGVQQLVPNSSNSIMGQTRIVDAGGASHIAGFGASLSGTVRTLKAWPMTVSGTSVSFGSTVTIETSSGIQDTNTGAGSDFEPRLSGSGSVPYVSSLNVQSDLAGAIYVRTTPTDIRFATIDSSVVVKDSAISLTTAVSNFAVRVDPSTFMAQYQPGDGSSKMALITLLGNWSVGSVRIA